MNSQPSVEVSAHSHATDPSVLIVILNWNAVDETKKAVRAAKLTAYSAFSILVIDNGSDAATHPHLRAMADAQVEVVFLPENRGFTGGCNYGLRMGLQRQVDFVWLFNNDATTTPSTLASLVDVAKQVPRVGLITPRIVASQDPGRELFTGGRYEAQIPTVTHTSNPALIREWSEKHPNQIVLAGTALLVSTALVRAVGYLDDTFFAYWEDMDYSIRSLNAGFRNVIDFRSEIAHFDKFFNAPPFSLRPHWHYYMIRNAILFWRKHSRGIRKIKRLRWTYRELLIELMKNCHNAEACQALCAGAWDGIILRTGAYRSDRRMPRLLVAALLWRSRQRPRLAVAS